jgi:nicotinamide phosphoribosyltransferase
MRNFMMLTDGYKVDHRRQYPPGTEYVYSNFTARSTRVGGADSVVFFGLRYFLQRYFYELAYGSFFGRSRGEVVSEYERFLKGYLGPNQVGVQHIADLYDLQHIPLRICALPEGTAVPFRVPMFTIENTHPDFFWVTNYFETLMSSVLWMPCTSASTAKRYRKILLDAAKLSGGDPAFVRWQGHDFSFRGMSCPEAAALSGAGHLLSFDGTDSIPSSQLIEDYYGTAGVGGTVPATEHSVMCAGGMETERETFNRLLKLYPEGVVSVVSDTWDLWKVLTEILPALHQQIVSRPGKLVIRPDSGDPVLILTGDASAPAGSPARKGVIELLWDEFGGAYNSEGFRVLDQHIGAIYGDSITEERARQICDRLRAKQFASTNVVLGIGSYTYQYVTRDTNGFAVKATWAKVNGQERFLHKNPVTDSGTKKSAIGRLVVLKTESGLCLRDGFAESLQASHASRNLLRPVWENGSFLGSLDSWAAIRARVRT